MTYKTTKTIFLSVILLAVSMSLVIGTSYAVEDKEKNDGLIREPIEKDNVQTYKSINVQEFDKSKINNYRTIATNDSAVKSILGEKYEYKNIMYRLDPVITVFELTYDTEDSRVNIVFENGEVIDINEYPIPEAWGYKNGYVVKSYDSTTDLKGIGHKFETPSSYSSSSSTANVLLTNGVKDGSNTANICNSGSSPTDYWGQAGVQFDSSGIRGGWTDTNASCIPTFFSLSISAGDEIVTRVYLDSSVSNKWWMTVDNLDDAYGPYGFTRTITGSTELLKDDLNTSVFWESMFTPNQGWDSDFGSDVVSDWASYKSTSNNNWYLWGSENEDTSICKPTANPNSVVAGSFDTSPYDVTWDVSDIEDDCGKGWY